MPDKICVGGLPLTRKWLDVGAAEDRIDGWIQLYNEASERLENPEVSYYSRCEFMQTGVDILRGNDRFDEALLEIEKLERANNEPDSEHYFQFWLIAKENRLLMYGKQGDWDHFDQIFYGSECISGRRVEKNGTRVNL